jgi:dolichol-phosphate mannosyltransferase
MLSKRPKTMFRVSVILATYNERENIEKLITTIMEIVNPFEVIVVDDESPDGTWKVVESLEFENLKLLKRVGKRGLPSAISDGIQMAGGDVVVWMDCDFSMHPKNIPSLLSSLDNYDVAVGSRYAKGGRDERNLGRILTSWILNRFAGLVLGRSVKDYTSGFVAAKKYVFEDITLKGDYGEYCIYFLYDVKRRFKVAEVPYTFTDRTLGKSKTFPSIFSPLRHAWVYGMTVLKARFGFHD